MPENNIVHDCRINNNHGLCGSEASMFTIDVAVHDDDDDENMTQPTQLVMLYIVAN